MRCNTLQFTLRSSLLAVAIVVPSLVAVNHFTQRTAVQRADGTPIPPLPPPKDVKLVAEDGTPIPPLSPPKDVTLVADGTPIPPLPPPKLELMGGPSA